MVARIALALDFHYAGATVSSNINSIVTIRLIASMDVSVYTPVASAVEIASGVAASFLFKEKFGVCSVAARVFALIAVVM